MEAPRHARLVLAVCALLALAPVSYRHGIRPEVSLPAFSADKKQADLATSARRRVYPLSVIAGGVYSSEELARARRTDAVVSAHYASFTSHPTFVKTDRDLLLYVSYRRADRVYWTRKPHLVRNGELLLVDAGGQPIPSVHLQTVSASKASQSQVSSTNMARARCGNQLSATPRLPVEGDREPSEDVLDQPETPKVAVSEMPLFEAPEPDLFVTGDNLPVTETAHSFASVGNPGPTNPGAGTLGPGYLSGPFTFPATYRNLTTNGSPATTSPGSPLPFPPVVTLVPIPLSAAPVPEPASIKLWLLGIASALLLAKLRQRA